MQLLQLLRWPIQLPQSAVLVAFTLLGYVLLAMLRHSSEVLFELMLLVLLPVFYLLFGMLALDGQIRLNDVARGRFVEPAFERGNLNPLQSPLAAKLAALFAAAGSLWLLPTSIWVLGVAGAVYPLLFLGLALEGSLRGLLNPQLYGRLILGLNFRLPLVVFLVSGSHGWLAYVLLHDQQLLSLAAASVLFLFVHQPVGLLVYSARSGLQLHTHDSPEQRHAAAAMERSSRLDRLLEDLQQLCGSGNLQQAITRLEVFLVEGQFSDDAMVHERLRNFQDRRLFLEHGYRYLVRCHQRDEVVLAWTLFKDCHAVDDQFRPPELAMLLDLTSGAQRGDAQLVEALLDDAENSYPDSAEIADAWFRQARINIESLGDGKKGLSLLKAIAGRFPEFAASEVYQKYQARLRVKPQSDNQP